VARIVVGLGGNLGDVPRAFRRARAMLAKIAGVRVLCSASLYRSAPVGDPDQDWFFNTALLLCVRLSPQAMLAHLQAIEASLGRVRDPLRRWGPRTIDLDLLVWDQACIEWGDALIVPHPRLHERRFALAPLAELWPHWRHPRLGLLPAQMLARFPPRAYKLIRLGRW